MIGLLAGLTGLAGSALGQYRSPYAPCVPCPDLQWPTVPRIELGLQTPDRLPAQAPATQAQDEGARGAALASGTAALPGFIGDQLGFSAQTGARPYRAPSVSGGLKITENEGMRPQDRVYVAFNYFNDVYGDYNRRLQASIGRLDLYRETFGFEKTLFDGRASIGLRLPLATLTADDRGFLGAGGSSTIVGDLQVLVKGTLWDDPAKGRYLSVGLLTTAPTGQGRWGDGTAYVPEPRDATLAPFVGYILRRGNVYLQGCDGFSFPTAAGNPVFALNDWSFGWIMYTNPDAGRLLSAVIPIFETHVLTPLTRGPLNTQLGVYDVVSLTEGVTLQLRRAFLTAAVAEPITGMKPFDVEAIVQLNVRY